MKIIQSISDSNTGLKREVTITSIFMNLVNETYTIQFEISFYTLINSTKVYLPVKMPIPEFVTTNNRRMLPDATGAISLFSDTEEGWENAIPETLFYDYLIQSNTVSLPDLIRGAILNLDSEKWNWFKEE